MGSSSEVESDLTLEKINAHNITRVEKKLDSAISSFNEKLDHSNDAMNTKLDRVINIVNEKFEDVSRGKQWNLQTMISLTQLIIVLGSVLVGCIIWISTSISAVNDKSITHQLDQNTSYLNAMKDNRFTGRDHTYFVSNIYKPNMKEAKEQLNKNTSALIKVESQMHEKFKEVETQKIMQAHTTNFQIQKVSGIVQALWSQAFPNTAYPFAGDDYYPLVGDYSVSPGSPA